MDELAEKYLDNREYISKNINIWVIAILYE